MDRNGRRGGREKKIDLIWLERGRDNRNNHMF